MVLSRGQSLSPSLVTVLMAVHNGARYLREAIDSILAQSFRDFEFVIVDDGSDDGSAAILDACDDDRVVHLANDSRRGLAYSLNRGLERARGELVARMDADDIALPARLTKQVEFMMNHPDVGVLGTQMLVVNDAGRVTGTYDVPRTHGGIAWRLLFGNPMAHPTVMYRRALVLEVGGYDDSLPASQDKELWVKLIRRTRFANLAERLIKYRRHPGAVWAREPDVAHRHSLEIGRRLADGYLGAEINDDDWEPIARSQKSFAVLTPSEMERAAGLIHRLYDAFIARERPSAKEAAEVQAEMLRRVIALGKRDGRIAPGDAMREYFRAKLPRPLWLLGKAAANPRRAAERLLKSDRRVLAERTPQRAADRAPDPSAAADATAKIGTRPVGISIVVVSFERPRALERLLQGLLDQDWRGVASELILVNNSPRVTIVPSGSDTIGRLLSRFDEPKVINSAYNWGPGIRYVAATAARFETILLFDDDIHPLDRSFVADMYAHFKRLQPVDILTCWADLWVEWDNENLSTVSMGPHTTGIVEVTECDYCGTGISMLSKEVLLCPQMLNIPDEYRFADTAWFPWIPNIVHGSRKYFFPCHRRLAFHDEKRKASLCEREGYEAFILAARRSMLERGYQPVKARLPDGRWIPGSPEEHAATTLPVVTRSWR